MKYQKMLTKYAVVWRDEARPFYGVPSDERIVCVEPLEDIKTKYRKPDKHNRKYYKADPLAIFDRKKEALSFWQNNKDWEVKRITILLSHLQEQIIKIKE